LLAERLLKRQRLTQTSMRSKLATNAVTTTKISDGTVTYVKLDSVTVLPALAENDQIVLSGQVFG